jgi:hypothetical protein
MKVSDLHIPHAGPSLRAPILWGFVFGAIQAASPLGFEWLEPATVPALMLCFIAAVYVGFAVADGRPHRDRSRRQRPHLDIPRLDLSNGLGDFLFGPVAPGDVLVVGAVVVEAAVEDSNEAVAEGA